MLNKKRIITEKFNEPTNNDLMDVYFSGYEDAMSNMYSYLYVGDVWVFKVAYHTGWEDCSSMFPTRESKLDTVKRIKESLKEIA